MQVKIWKNGAIGGKITVFENNSFGGFREGCGTLKASGGDYGGGLGEFGGVYLL